MMWKTQQTLYRDISNTAMRSAHERTASWKTLISSAVIFILVANHAVRLSRADAFARKPLPPADYLARKRSRGTTRALKRSGDGPDSQTWDQDDRHSEHHPHF
ncbi:hypothetical protein PCC82_20730 [Agrobacterium deltaense]